MAGKPGRSGRKVALVASIANAPLPETSERLTASDAPELLDDAQRRMWAEYLRDAPRLLCRADGAMLCELVIARTQYDAAMRELSAHGMLVLDRFGQSRVHPLLPESHKLAARIRFACSELGFSPKAREQVKAGPPPEERNPFADI